MTFRSCSSRTGQLLKHPRKYRFWGQRPLIRKCQNFSNCIKASPIDRLCSNFRSTVRCELLIIRCIIDKNVEPNYGGFLFGILLRWTEGAQSFQESVAPEPSSLYAILFESVGVCRSYSGIINFGRSQYMQKPMLRRLHQGHSHDFVQGYICFIRCSVF